MATYTAIAAVSQALLKLLEQACPKPEFDGARFELYQARDFKTPMDEGVSLYLFRAIPSTVRRNLPGRVDAQGRRALQPLLLDLHYLLTPWARSAVRQHRILGWALRTLEDTPTLPSSLLNHYGGPETDTFLPDETVSLLHEPLSLPDLLNVWEVGKPNVQVSATYVARLVALESTLHEPVPAPVTEVRVQYGRRRP